MEIYLYIKYNKKAPIFWFAYRSWFKHIYTSHKITNQTDSYYKS
jgi:hypothetical protein